MRAAAVVLAAFGGGAAGASQCGAKVMQDTGSPDTAFRWTNETSWENCCSSCADDSACGAFSYAPQEAGHHKGNCHLKRSASSTHKQKNTVSGVFGSTPAPGPSPTSPPGPTPVPAPTPPPDPKAPRPHIVMILQDDLGFDNIAFNNAEWEPYSSSIGSLAKEGMVLQNHYVHWHCSPTRRSFLTGRLPIHHGEMLSPPTGDDMDLRWNLISQKLATAGYRCLWYGKGHTGYKSMNHLPTSRKFESWVGFLGGAQGYSSSNRWKDEAPYHNTTYSSYLYGDYAVKAVEAHDPSTPMFMYLPWQSVHEPYQAPPDPKPAGTVLQQMMWSSDVYIGKVVAALKEKEMWEKTLMVYSADNGGVDDGCNYPLRGEKHTNWQGGMQVAAFVSGGFLPSAARGTTASVALHVVDWYPTFCALAGVDAADGSEKPPLPVDPSLPPTNPPPKDIYGNHSWPDIDGVNVWPILLDAARRNRRAEAHAELTLSREVILINGTMKLVVAQPDPSILATHGEMPPKNNFTLGWKYPNGTWVLPSAFDSTGCGLSFLDRTSFVPCLFDVEADPRETNNLAAREPALTALLWKKLNTSYLTWYHSRTPAEMLGVCDADCAVKHWKGLGDRKGSGPICGVPTCA
eukprot:TRINITY_DN39251_c0_g1_i1.p1 TRINITY_DN39251_c0_g1~~TRINITY_DN39251_c0_g1_i1.p1  ORF type:complete len:629 (+),score=222.81 TRINITY_DN39251_c0_g1_i1:76-1962(+)